MSAKIYIVGLGPGSKEHMSLHAIWVVESVDVVVGYKTYTSLVEKYLNVKKVVSSGMRKEQERCQEVIEFAKAGESVALVSSGDAGVYGMAGVMLETLHEAKLDIEVEVVPGISSCMAAASILGAPLMHDFAVISLSDLLTDWSLIKKRVKAAAEADFVIALYNPKSKKRVTQLKEAHEIILQYKSPDTPVGIVKHAMREEQQSFITTLKDLLNYEIDMFTTIIIGNSQTYIDRERIVTPRGYKF